MRMFISMLVITMLASPAMAAPALQAIGVPIDGTHTAGVDPDFSNNTITRPLAITPDGKFVAGQAYDGTYNVGFLYEVATGLCRDVYGGGYNTEASGVGYTNTGAIMVNGKDSGWNSCNISADGGATWTKQRYTYIGPYSLGSFNSAAGGPSTTDSGGNGAVGNTYAGMYHPGSGGALYAGGVDAADVLLTLFAMKSMTGTDHYLGGISSEGVGVGERDNQNVMVRLDQSPNQAFFRGLGAVGDNNGRAWDISDDGAWVVGHSIPEGDTANRAYVKDMSDLAGLATELPGLPGAAWSYAYGISSDGSYAVGISDGAAFNGLGEQAMLWDLTGATPVAIHLNTFFTNWGLMGSFTDLFKPYSVGVNASGEVVVAGRGRQGANEVGFVATISQGDITGSCCLGDGTCQDGKTPTECNALSGILTFGATCAETNCNGACCLPDSPTCQYGTLQECDTANGEFQGLGSLCSEGLCGGACCLPDATCEFKSPAGCIAVSGEFNGLGSFCDDVVCGGACCLPSATCQQTMTEIDCDALSGDFHGLGIACDDVTCCADPFADADTDGDVDQKDFGIWQACFSGDGKAHPAGGTYKCACFNRDAESENPDDIDEFDFAAFEACWSGPTVTALTTCDD